MWIDAAPVEQVGATGGVTAVMGGETAPNTLSQLVYLSYKNHGRFLLDLLQWRVQEQAEAQLPVTRREIAEAARKPLDAYAEALDKDDTDVEVWRASAAVAMLVGCNRIARFCLEAVLDMGEENLDDVLGLPNVEQTLALSRLQEMAKSLQDDLSRSLAPLPTQRRQKLGEALMKRLESHASIPKPTFEETAYSKIGLLGQTPLRYVMRAPKRDWTAVGETIIQQQMLIEGGLVDTGPGIGMGIDFPEGMEEDSAPTTVLSLPERPVSATNGPRANELSQAIKETTIPTTTTGDSASNIGEQNTDAANKSAEDTEASTVDAIQQVEQPAAPSRKRSPESAELPEDDGRGRSKRMRNRGDAPDGGKPDEAKINADWQLGIYKESDGWLNDATNVFLKKLGLQELVSAGDLRSLVEGEKSFRTAGEGRLGDVIKEVYDLTTSCPPEMVGILSNGMNNENIDSFGAASREAGLNAFLGGSASRGAQACEKPVLGAAEGLQALIDAINSQWYYPKEAAWKFLSALLKPGSFPGSDADSPPSYIMHRWPEDLKRCVVQLAVRFDDDIYSFVQEDIMRLNARELKSRSLGVVFTPSQNELNTIELVQTLFELHLDVYSLIKRPGTNVDSHILISQKDRLERWSALANNAINLRIPPSRETSEQENQAKDELTLRHLWATAFHISVCDDVRPEHVLGCMKDLKTLLIEMGEPIVHLQNNAVVPEISLAAVEQELSKMNMKGFFERIFCGGEADEKEEDPVETIHSLEPLLEGSIDDSSRTGDGGNDEEEVSPDEQQLLREALGDEPAKDPTPHEQMSKFLANSTWTLRLSLWQRLRQAYEHESVDYAPKVVSCHLRSIELLTKEMLSGNSGTTGEARKKEILRWLHLIEEFAYKLLYLQVRDFDMFECVDLAHLKSSITAVTQLLQMLHAFNLYEDQVRVGAIPPPTFEGKPKPAFAAAAKWLHALQIRLWMLLYRMFQEAIEQEPEVFENPTEVKMEFLRTLHYALGQRKICGEANRELLHLLLDEMLALSDSEYFEQELAQVVLDLYNLKFAAKPEDELLDHGCADHAEPLTRKAALKLLGFFMAQAQRVPMKDMPKHDIRGAVEKVQGALGKGKSTDDLLLNSRVYSSFMKSTINPLDLFACLRGTFEIPTKPIPAPDAPVASKGWYYLLGMIALNKFKSVKRISPGPAEDLMTAQAFFRQDIEYCSEHWESWYRLAQCNDLHLEEHISWSADKLNAHSHEVFHYQRQALHAYIMAASSAVRNADEKNPKTLKLVAEMYKDFGERIYASSREPFSMGAFGFMDKEERHFSGEIVYQRPPFNPLSLFTAWRLASVLFKRSLARVPDAWLTHHMLGKCLWKMYTHDFAEGAAAVDAKYRPPKQDVIDCFVKAITKLPKRDSRKEPILEPHYKLVAIVHKLFKRGDLTKSEAHDLLKTSSYAAKVPLSQPDGQDDSWNEYVVRIVKSLRSADKAGWHHRMTARAAHLVYDDSPLNPVSAMEAKHELTQQMFTKTMVLQVWKPEFERPGRHFVYTTRYVQFFVRLLAQLGDREGLSALVKRLRRKPDQYFDHAKLWQETCVTYLRLLRKTGSVPDGHEDTVFKSLNHEEFTTRSAKLEVWCHTKGEKSLTYSVLTDVIELKKVNNGLMKATLIDDLLGDTYAKLYEEVGVDQLAGIELPKTEGASATTPAPMAAPPAPAPAPPAAPKPMSLTSVMNMDGATDNAARSFTPPQPEPAQPPQQQHKPRVKLGVGRREIQRKAEAAVNLNKPPSTSTPARSLSISATPTQNQVVQVVIPSPRRPSVVTPRPSLSGSVSGGTGGTPLPANPYASASTAAAAAVAMAGKVRAHISTPFVPSSESESELSELEEEPEEPSQFARPGGRFTHLKGGSPAGSSTTAREVEEVEGDGEDDENAGDDEGGDGEEDEDLDEEEGEDQDAEVEGDTRDHEGDEKMEG